MTHRQLIDSAPRRPQRGMTLIELMVALAIGMFLMIGAVTVFMQGRSTFRVAEAVARLQENARFALDTLEPDIRMAQYWGLTNRSTYIDGRAGTTVPGGVPTNCGNTWVSDLENSVAGTNNSYTWNCAGNAPVETNSDTLVVRRVTEDPVGALAANTVYIQSNRFARSQMFVGTVLPALPDPATSQTFRLVVNGYYVSRGNTSNLSTATNTVPSLRMKTLLASTATIQDREILPGVEDLQVQFGIDTSPPNTDERGTIDRFVNPGDAIFADATYIANQGQILAVRIWIRVRAERTEQGFTDTTNYVYADQDVGPFNDGYRRLVVSKTIFLRNANFT